MLILDKKILLSDNCLNKIDNVKREYKDIDSQLSDENVKKNKNLFGELLKKKAFCEKIMLLFDKYQNIQNNINYDIDISNQNKNEEKIYKLITEDFDNEVIKLKNIVKEIVSLLHPKNSNDTRNIIMEIKGAVGGEEANLFASDLFRMYTKFASKNLWKIKILNSSQNKIGGMGVTFKISGNNVYGKLKYESGVHRVQRIPKTETNGRIHTSTALVLVMPEAQEIDVSINPKDLRIDTYRSQGAGGQNVNKTESAVRITHIPTGIVASCQVEKSQIQNKKMCMEMLLAKIYQKKITDQRREIENERKSKLGSGDRSEKIRTYNFPDNRVTDHRINLTIKKLDNILDGDLDCVINALIENDNENI